MSLAILTGILLPEYRPVKNADFPIVTSTAEAQDTKEPARPEPSELTPYTISNYISYNPNAELGNIWKRLGITDRSDAGSLVTRDGPLLSVCNRCDVQTFHYDLDGEAGNEIILRISYDLQQECRYLVFKQIEGKNDQWKLLGNIDHDFGRYAMPEHSFLLSRGRGFLTVRVQTLSGSGVAMYHNRLFAVRRGRLMQVLTFPADGHESMGYGLNREFDVKTTDLAILDGSAEVSLQFNVRYTTWDEENGPGFTLMAKRQTAVYRKPLNAKKAYLDPARSNITQEEIDAVYAVGSLSDEDFLRYNRKEFDRIMLKKGTRAYRFLDEYKRRIEAGN